MKLLKKIWIKFKNVKKSISKQCEILSDEYHFEKEAIEEWKFVNWKVYFQIV
jgi:hypothetical protein